jgi:hypothetical protein
MAKEPHEVQNGDYCDDRPRDRKPRPVLPHCSPLDSREHDEHRGEPIGRQQLILNERRQLLIKGLAGVVQRFRL